jgi:protein-arginine kinase activator protein McsA
MAYKSTEYCDRCDAETKHHTEVERLRSFDEVDVEDLSSTEYSKIDNGDPTLTVSCEVCGNTYETI